MDSVEALRRRTLWRLWVRGTQIEVPAFVATFAFGSLAARHVPNVVGTPVTLAGLATCLVGFGMTAVSLPALLLRYYSLFNGLQALNSTVTATELRNDLAMIGYPVQNG